jgi:hypothetical protein
LLIILSAPPLIVVCNLKIPPVPVYGADFGVTPSGLGGSFMQKKGF